MAKKQEGPSKSDLLKVLKTYDYHQSKALKNRKEDEKKAMDTMNQFLKECKEYQKLVKAYEYASGIEYDLRRQEQEDLRARLRQIRNHIWTHGANAKAVEMIEQLQKDFQ